MTFLKRYYLYIIFILLGFAAGALYFGIPSKKNGSAAKSQKCSYSLINPLRCGDDVPVQTEYTVFKKKLA